MSSKKHEDDEDDKKVKAKEVQAHDAAKGRSALAPNQPVADHMAPSAPKPLDVEAAPAEVAPPKPPSDPPPHGSPSEQERYADMKAADAQLKVQAKAEADAAAKAAKEAKGAPSA